MKISGRLDWMGWQGFESTTESSKLVRPRTQGGSIYHICNHLKTVAGSKTARKSRLGAHFRDSPLRIEDVI
jgi:hypothetical protein